MANVKINPTGGKVVTTIRILKEHIGVTAVDLWDDTDHNDRPDRFVKRVKQPNHAENQPADLGDPGALCGKIVQWIWMPSQPPMSTEGWTVEIDLAQDGNHLASMPMKLAGDYPDGQGYGIFQAWRKLVCP